jgi:hypothetical protein
MITHLYIGCEGSDGLAEGERYRSVASIIQNGHVIRETAHKTIVALDLDLELVSRSHTSRDRCPLLERPKRGRGVGNKANSHQA